MRSAVSAWRPFSDGDPAFELISGAVYSDDANPRRVRKNIIKVGEGLSAARVSAAVGSVAGALVVGVSAAAAKRTRRNKGEGVRGGALLSRMDLDNIHGQPESDRRQQYRSRLKVVAIGLSARACLAEVALQEATATLEFAL